MSGRIRSSSSSGGGVADAFTTIQPDSGTSPTASGSDTLNLTSSDGTIDISGDATTDTIDFTIPASSKSNSFETIVPTAGANVVADSSTDTLTLTASDSNIVITGTAATDTLDFTIPNLSGTNTGDQNIWSQITCPSGTNPTPDSTSDTLTLTTDSNLTITGDSSTDTIAFAIPNLSGTNTGDQNIWSTIDCPAGSDPAPDGTSDTLTLTSDDGNLVITGNSTTDTIDFSLNTEVQVDDKLEAGDPGSEGSGVVVNGTTYAAKLRANDFGSSAPALMVLHKHSTSFPATIIGSRSNSDTSSHGVVTNGQVLFDHTGVGWTTTDYKIFGRIRIAVDDTGTVSDTSAPGKIEFVTVPDGSLSPAVAMTIDNAGDVAMNNDLSVTGSITGSNLSGTNTGDQNIWSTIACPAGTNPAPDGTSDQLNLAVGSTKLSITGDSGTDTITFDVVQANIDHDALLNFVADEHVAHTSVTLTAGDGLAGGGDISANRTFDVDITNETLKASPVSGDELLIADSAAAGAIKKITVGSLPGGSSTNSFETINCPAGTDPVADSATDTLNLTSTSGLITIAGNSTTDTVDFDLNAAITDLTDVSAKSGTGTTVLFQGSPTITTPTIASFVNATHDHSSAAEGGALVEHVEYHITVPDDDTYTIVLAAKYQFDVNEVTYKCESGTITGNVKIDGTSITSLNSLSISSTEATTAATGANTVNVDDTLEITFSSNSDAFRVTLSFEIQRS